MLIAIPVFHMQLIQMLMGILKSLDRLCRRCIWGEEDNSTRMHSIRWTILCKPKRNGGLGFRRALDINKVLLSKLIWRLHTESDQPWVLLMKEKYRLDSWIPKYICLHPSVRSLYAGAWTFFLREVGK